MVSIFCTILVSFLIICLFLWLVNFDWGTFVNIMITLLCIALFVLTMWGSWWLNIKNCQHTESITHELYSGFNSTEYTGSFFLLGGSMDGEDRVFYWEKDNNDILRKFYVPMNGSTFIEDGKNIMIETYLNKCEPRWLYMDDPIYSYEFHIPKGSVYTMFNYK